MKLNDRREAQRWLMQAAEKVLKAYLYSQGSVEVWGHSVAELCTDCSAHDPDFSKLKSKAASLDKHYIPTRYPNGLPGGIPSDVYQEEDRRQAILLTDEIIRFVSGKMK